ncbi:hypothetical protein [Terrisporobacter mayombei]|uniref:Uncharacterized protein n=1 Tax=Terrisporobacter mayombei TaxID=1541 RepID=A0ABY9PY72_9FIRM|nr:hypothetical protein [Terrisporobacter mayombei]MCC3868478.1 hypothetical protein [Terrisporobacter mayombei]WMT80631.1 hypothetical protein TEMA_09520 [Terrisporobacter mayombei]
MSINGFENQIRWINNALDSLESKIESGDIMESISDLGDLKGEIKELISEAEEVIDVIKNL